MSEQDRDGVGVLLCGAYRHPWLAEARAQVTGHADGTATVDVLWRLQGCTLHGVYLTATGGPGRVEIDQSRVPGYGLSPEAYAELVAWAGRLVSLHGGRATKGGEG